jgi:Arc/MetJ family transcription regulator
MHIELDDDLVADVDRLAGPRGRSDFVRDALRAAGAIEAEGHEWDRDPAAWVEQQRQGDRSRVG